MNDSWRKYLSSEETHFLLAALAVIVVVAIAANIITRLLKRWSPPGSFTLELAEHTSKALHLLLPLIALQTAISSAAETVELASRLRHITSVAIIAAFTWLALRAVSAIEDYIVLRNPADISDNLRARQIQTQTRVLTRTLAVLVLILGTAGILMTFPGIRQFGTSLLASAGLAGLIAGFAARPVLGNLIAGLQIAITQPIRLDDVVIMENEWGRIEEITGSYVVVRLWDSRRLVVPLQWIIENPFQNWTRQTSKLIGSVFFWLDYSVPLAAFREEAERLCREVPHLWDGEVFVVQVTECSERAMQLRVLASSSDSSRSWDLRCYLREHLLAYVASNFPEALPNIRAHLHSKTSAARAAEELTPAAPLNRE